jgi:uncharacterized protein
VDNTVMLLSLGLAAGVFSALFGVGGGIIIVPGLVALGLTMHKAVGTSLAIIIPTAISGVYAHYVYGNIETKVLVLVAVGAVIGAQFGAAIAENLQDTLLKRLFGVFIILVGLKMALGK